LDRNQAYVDRHGSFGPGHSDLVHDWSFKGMQVHSSSAFYWLLGLFGTYVIVSLWYIRRLNERIRSFEQDWSRIEELTDHNLDGDIVIHAKHLDT